MIFWALVVDWFSLGELVGREPQEGSQRRGTAPGVIPERADGEVYRVSEAIVGEGRLVQATDCSVAEVTDSHFIPAALSLGALCLTPVKIP